ncbi:rho GTPase-activating protein 100F-like [Armigeres subalbatus]|uniref:rho GTPase-activating protein 100F-like n=1 Tax=Armigeres subalbatus TaxID=124917 RepID=UPI002ED6ADE0
MTYLRTPKTSSAAGGTFMYSLPVRSISSQHIGPSSIRSPSVRRMRQLLKMTQAGPDDISGTAMAALTGHQSPAPTPSTKLPRTHHPIDINPAEYSKLKLDKTVFDAIEYPECYGSICLPVMDSEHV